MMVELFVLEADATGLGFTARWAGVEPRHTPRQLRTADRATAIL